MKHTQYTLVQWVRTNMAWELEIFLWLTVAKFGKSQELEKLEIFHTLNTSREGMVLLVEDELINEAG